jgi:serine/threonine protein kinase
MKKTNKKYALKEMSKVKIIDRRSEKSIKTEREFLSKLRHPFIVNMNCAFQDYENLYLVMDLLTGGDLRYHLCKFRHFSEEETKFFVACLLLGLEYIHGNNIIHRDIKPENLVFDEKGYLRITDFGVAKVRKEDNSSETSGTPGYMAPEVLMAHNHSFPVDFFAIGVMGYEFMLGQRPYIGRNRKEIKHQVLRKQAKIEEEDIVEGWSQESVDFINNCLKRKDSRRLGFTGGVKDLKNHIWFQNYDWDSLLNKTLIAPFVPPKGGNYDKKYCEAVEKHTEETLERYQGYRDKKNFAFLFEGYTYINYELTQITSLNESNTRMTTNTKYSKPVISTNPSANNNKRKNRNNKFINGPILENNTPVFNTQKKIKINGNKNIINFYNNDNINIVSNHLLLSNDINEKNSKHQQIKEDKRNLSKYKIKLGDINNVNDTLLSNLASSSTSLLNINNGSQNIKKINGLINPDKNPMRSSSVGHFNLENMKQQNKNSTKTKFIDINSNKAASNINILSNLSNVNDLSSVINNMGSLSNLSGEPTQMKNNYNDNYLENNNSHRMKNNNNIDNKTKIGVKMSANNSKLGFYLPQLNNGKTINHEFSNHNINPNGKLRNKLNISQFRFKINNGNKKGINLNNKLLIIPGNNYQPIFKRSESTGFINFGTNISNKSNKAIKNNYTKKNFVGISNSLLNDGYNNCNDKKLYRNASDIFH